MRSDLNTKEKGPKNDNKEQQQNLSIATTALNHDLQMQGQKKANARRNKPMVEFFDTASNQSINGAIVYYLMLLPHLMLDSMFSFFMSMLMLAHMIPVIL